MLVPEQARLPARTTPATRTRGTGCAFEACRRTTRGRCGTACACTGSPSPRSPGTRPRAPRPPRPRRRATGAPRSASCGAAAEGARRRALHRPPLDRTPRPVVIACSGPAMPIALVAVARLGIDVMPVSPGVARGVPARRAARRAAHPRRRAARRHSGARAPTRARQRSDRRLVGSATARPRAPLAAAAHRAPRPAMAGTITTHVQGAMGVQGLRQLAGLHDRLGIEGTDVILTCAPLHRGKRPCSCSAWRC